MQPQSAVQHGLPGIDARPVGAIVVRLQAFPGQQFSVGDQEIQLQPPLVGVLHPQNAVLVFIEPGRHGVGQAAGASVAFSGFRGAALNQSRSASGVYTG